MNSLNWFFVAAITVFLFGMTAPMASSQTDAVVKPASAQGKIKTHRFRQGEYHRRYRLYSPGNEKQLTGQRPLVMVAHGGGSSDRGMEKLDKKRWQELADRYGFYVVYPNAVGRLWDFGEGKTSEDLDKRVDDLTYFHRVLDGVSNEKNIDPNRIFVTGISRGGQASYYLACNMPERIRAITSVTMSLPEFMVDECQSAPPIGVAIINGTADPLVPYEGGYITTFGKDKLRDPILSTEQTLALWRNRNECDPKPTSKAFIDGRDNKTSVNMTEWAKCSGDPVKLFKVNNGGHTWPSGIQYLGVRIVGYTSREINASDEAWAFFSRF